MAQHYATLKDVAKLAGTTAGTVSYVLSGKEGRYISDDMRRRVMQAVEELGYVKSSAASSLRGKKRGIIAVLVPQFSNQFFTRIVVAIEAVADQKGYILSICNTFDDPKREREIVNRMAQHRVDGYIISPTTAGKENTSQVRRLGVPLVLVDRSMPGVEEYPLVTFSNYQCGYMAAEYLLKMGHRKIAFLDWNSSVPDLEQRLDGFQDAMTRYGIPPQERICRLDVLSDESGYRMTQETLESHPDITAILFANNIQAKGGVRYLSQQGLKIGEDISIILIGSPEWASVGGNDFAHIEQHEEEMGWQAASLLLELIENPDAQCAPVTVNCSLHPGTSVKNLLENKGSPQ